jgi:hypothetical protein
LDTAFEVFGSESHCYQLNPPLPPQEVDALERRHRISLPDEYRAFITRIGNGGAGPDYGLFSLAAGLRESASELNRPFPFSTQTAQEVIAARRRGERYAAVVPAQMPGGALAICHSGCAIFYYIVLAGEQRGTVWNGREDWFPCSSRQGRQWTFLDWYEDWLDRWLVPGAILASMTEEVWLHDDQAETMLRFAGDSLSERKRRLACAACCRRLWDRALCRRTGRQRGPRHGSRGRLSLAGPCRCGGPVVGEQPFEHRHRGRRDAIGPCRSARPPGPRLGTGAAPPGGPHPGHPRQPLSVRPP